MGHGCFAAGKREVRQVKEGAAKWLWHGAREQSIADDDCIGMCLQVSVEILLAAEVQVAFPLECPVEREEAADRHGGAGSAGSAGRWRGAVRWRGSAGAR